MPPHHWLIACVAAVICHATGCGRLGYPSHGRSSNDGAPSEIDAAGVDAAARDAVALDARASDASTLDAAPSRDAGEMRDAPTSADAGADASMDAGLPEPVCEPGINRSCGMGGFQTCSPAGTWCQCNGDSAMGSPGGWSGCRGNGLAVCTELVAGYPCYWENNPRCASNPTCGGTYLTCNRDCPAPSAGDACMCTIGIGGWLGCGDGCSVCDDVLEAYPCYFAHHWACEPASCGDAREICDSRCPAPTAADRGSATPAP